MLASMLALTLGTTAFAQQAPEPDHYYAKFHLDRRGNVEAMEACDRTTCWSVDLTEQTATYNPATGGFNVADDIGVTFYWDCWEDEEQLMSICVWKEFRFYGYGCNPEHCA